MGEKALGLEWKEGGPAATYERQQIGSRRPDKGITQPDRPWVPRLGSQQVYGLGGLGGLRRVLSTFEPPSAA